ncbi:c-type cytochrome [Pseudohalocynthiibacter aestuariivivens]|jgi:cytochrome c|uniref:C-type cytochrome n=1 Tax=Pseudohalocynthiibacter aestuariivivens TaxID=1591409 RepID=A0ABV5JGR1_9RHOB|nr:MULTISPECIES: c-type cytochrome [Pseudohalocynthiibacter]MBS9718120.1 c-type cytochrome [Pseudohalocynthiibacter aestuariivivens]MCK0103770.1 c-type cytochrome [Pseudohalocynthiibacter sp. F2068]
MRRIFLTTLLSLGFASQVTAEAGGNAERGEALFRQCAGCHQVGEGAEHRIGPSLNGVFDRSAGAAEGFRYSNAMERTATGGLVWTYESLDTFIENPRNLVSGTRMSFRGIANQKDRDDLLAYLRLFSASPANIPEAAPTAKGLDHDFDPEILAISGDPAYGEYLSNECTTCHLLSGNDNGIPSITNWPVEDFVIALHAYKNAKRLHPVMQMMAGRLSNEEIAALAAYFKSLDQ